MMDKVFVYIFSILKQYKETYRVFSDSLSLHFSLFIFIILFYILSLFILLGLYKVLKFVVLLSVYNFGYIVYLHNQIICIRTIQRGSISPTLFMLMLSKFCNLLINLIHISINLAHYTDIHIL